jgi:predicted nucleotidyltransferase
MNSAEPRKGNAGMTAEAKTIDARAFAERARVLRILREHEAELRAQGVTRLRLFGSMARGDNGPDSDVDLIAEIDRSMSFSLLDLVGLQDFLRDLLGRKVDVGTTIAKMRPRMRQRFEAEAIEVF